MPVLESSYGSDAEAARDIAEHGQFGAYAIRQKHMVSEVVSQRRRTEAMAIAKELAIRNGVMSIHRTPAAEGKEDVLPLPLDTEGFMELVRRIDEFLS